jgi:hypothetical protein
MLNRLWILDSVRIGTCLSFQSNRWFVGTTQFRWICVDSRQPLMRTSSKNSITAVIDSPVSDLLLRKYWGETKTWLLSRSWTVWRAWRSCDPNLIGKKKRWIEQIKSEMRLLQFTYHLSVCPRPHVYGAIVINRIGSAALLSLNSFFRPVSNSFDSSIKSSWGLTCIE